jgi:AraC-like DNA-binding protein
MPFALYGTIMPNLLTFYPTHWHDEMELVYAEKGKSIYYVDFKPYIMEEGDILIIPPTTIHSFEQYGEEEFVGYTCVFNLNMVNNSSVDVCSEKYFTPLYNNEIILKILLKKSDEGWKNISEIVYSIMRCYYKKDDCYELRMKMYLYEMFCYYFEHRMFEENTNSTVRIKVSEKTKTIITYIEEHYQEKITLEKLARETNQSVYNLAHSFKKCTGISPLEYINQYRLSIAARELETTKNPVINIAVDTGFNNVSYFNRAFRAKYNMTPTEYRKKVWAGE